MAKFKSKNERLLAAADVYYELHGKKPFSTDEVAQWAIARDLYPCPKRGCSEAEADAWERKLELVKVAK